MKVENLRIALGLGLLSFLMFFVAIKPHVGTGAIPTNGISGTPKELPKGRPEPPGSPKPIPLPEGLGHEDLEPMAPEWEEFFQRYFKKNSVEFYHSYAFQFFELETACLLGGKHVKSSGFKAALRSLLMRWSQGDEVTRGIACALLDLLYNNGAGCLTLEEVNALEKEYRLDCGG